MGGSLAGVVVFIGGIGGLLCGLIMVSKNNKVYICALTWYPYSYSGVAGENLVV